MLSVGAVANALIATPDAPPVITLHDANPVLNVWDFEGTVTDKGHPVAGATVQFGGVLAKYHLTATVQTNGTYDVTEVLPDVSAGSATAQTCVAGKASNVAMTFVDARSSTTSQAAPSLATFAEATGAGATIATVAGTARNSGDGGSAADASLYSPQCVAVDSSGDLLIADTYNNVIREVNASTGAITTVAGDGICGYSGDGGAAAAAELNAPAGIAADAAGDLFIADSGNEVIREVDQATGAITTVAGSGTYGYSGDGGAATSAALACPSAVAVDSAGNLFIADSGNNVIREVDLCTGIIATVAGNYALGSGYSGDGGAAGSAQLSHPTGVAVDAAGDLFIADTCNNVVREVDSAGLIATVAGNYALGSGYSGNGGAATSAQLGAPWGVAVDGTGNLFIADSVNNAIRKVCLSSGQISTVAGNGNWGYSGNGGPATSAKLSDPTAIAVDAAGDLFIADSIDNAIREVDSATDLIDTVAGNGAGNYSGNGEAATGSELYDPMNVAIDTAGNLFIADSNNNVVREVNVSTGVITTVAGSGIWGYSGDNGAATSAKLFDPMGVAVDAAGDIFIADSGNNVVRKVDLSTGVISTVAGNGTSGYSGDGGAATSAQLNDPTGIAVDAAGDLVIADSGNNVIREVDSAGAISTVAGSYALGSGYSGDGGAATSAQLSYPTDVAVDAAGDLFIADTCNNVVREVDSAGVISTVAGNYALGSGYSGDGGAATSAQLSYPTGVAVDAVGNLYIADTGNSVVREIDSAGAISTVAGNGVSGYGGDGGAASDAQLNNPGGMAVDGMGNLFIADSGNNVIRKIRQPLYWDPQQTGAEDAGGAGVWTTESDDKYWYDPSLGADVAWSDGSDAVFSGAAATVTISGTVSPASITFATDDYLVMNATSSDGLMLPSGGTSIDVEGALATIDSPIGGSAALTVTGQGTVALGGVDTYAGGTDLEGGTLQLGSGATLGSGSLTVNAGALDLAGNSITVATLSGNGGTITNSNPSTTSTLTVDQGASAAYYGSIQDGDGAVGLTMAGSGVLVAAGANAYSGGTTITSGRFVATSSSALPYGTGLTVGADGTVVFDPSGTPTLIDPGQNWNLHDRDGLGTNPPTGPIGPTSPIDQAPMITAIQCAGQPLVDADAVSFNLLFDVPVSGVSPANFAAGGNGTTGTVTSVVETSYCQYTVTVSGISGRGNLGLSVVNRGTIVDWFGTPLAATLTIPVDQQYTISRQLYWDASGSNGAAGGSGTWGPDNDDWHVGSPSGPMQAWVDGSDAVFAGAPGAITIAGPVVVGSMTFLSDGYVLQGASITLVPSPDTPSPPAPLPSCWVQQAGEGSMIDVAVGSATIDCQIVGALLKTDDGRLVLGGGTDPLSSITIATGILDLDGTIATTTTLTLDGGAIVNGVLDAETAVNVYSGTILADICGPAALNQLGLGTVVLAGHDTYSGGTSVEGTLVAMYADSLPAGTTPTGSGTVLVQPTLYWSGSGDWTTGTWELADGTPTPWIDGSNVVIAAGSDVSVSGPVDVGAITVAGDATIEGGTLVLPSWGGTITVLAGTATINSTIAGGGSGGGLTETGPGTLVLDGVLAYAGTTIVAGGTLDLQSPLAATPVIAGGRAIGPGALFSGDGESLFDLDPAMFNLVQSLFVDQTIDRADMIQVLESAITSGAVTSSALSALETLTTPQNESRLNMPDYVAVLANDVVWGSPANATYQGQPLGNLADQGTAGGTPTLQTDAGKMPTLLADQLRATALNDLVGKWFEGTDQPAIDTTAIAAGASYSVVAGALFGDNPNQALDAPSSADMHQGTLGDCYLIAALGALADSSPQTIENMIIPNGVENGIASYTVRFYYQSGGAYVADYVTVSALLPGYSGGALVYAGVGADGSWWLPLVEKAYAEWNETGREGRDGQNAYASLGWGCMQSVDEQVLGRAATTYCPASDPAAEQAVIAALANGEAVTAAIGSSGDATRFNQLGLVSGHAYVVMGYDGDPASPTFGTFQLENPWGGDEPTASLTWGDLAAYCGGLAVADATGTVPLAGANSPATGMSGAEMHAEALRRVAGRQYVPDAAWVAYLAGNGTSQATDATQDPRIRAANMVLAEFGQ